MQRESTEQNRRKNKLIPELNIESNWPDAIVSVFDVNVCIELKSGGCFNRVEEFINVSSDVRPLNSTHT